MLSTVYEYLYNSFHRKRESNRKVSIPGSYHPQWRDTFTSIFQSFLYILSIKEVYWNLKMKIKMKLTKFCTDYKTRKINFSLKFCPGNSRSGIKNDIWCLDIKQNIWGFMFGCWVKNNTQVFMAWIYDYNSISIFKIRFNP